MSGEEMEMRTVEKYLTINEEVRGRKLRETPDQGKGFNF